MRAPPRCLLLIYRFDLEDINVYTPTKSAYLEWYLNAYLEWYLREMEDSVQTLMKVPLSISRRCSTIPVCTIKCRWSGSNV